ncbi:hypothetical protein FACS1894184_16130 [Clostridia bacterium]|nr:hypothetical protein FACS1894184_16130 [Clostridia bacterium]
MTMRNDRRFALVFRLCSLLFAMAGVLKQIGVFGGSVHLGSLMFYTMQSNLLVIVMFAMLTIRTAQGLYDGRHGSNGWYSRFEMICTVDILLTFVVFWILLTPGSSTDFLLSFENLSAHTFTPVLCLIDYMLFSERKRLKYHDVYYTCIFPALYVLFTAIAGLAGYVYWYNEETQLTVRAPYFFLDYYTIGTQAGLYIIAILIFILAVSHVFFWIDRKGNAASAELDG